MGFPKDFAWGAATSAYQIEGAAYEDGKGLSIWDVFCKDKGDRGRIANNETGDVACDHYHRYKEDVQLIKEIGLNSYRFSINWTRILPEGIGKVNEKGIAFYNNLINELIDNGIEPYITLYHWDLPHELFKKGGWLNDDCVEWFAEYAKVIAENFSDRVQYYFTFNEPQCFLGAYAGGGTQAPNIKYPLKDQLQIIHNTLKAHGAAVSALRKYAVKPIKVGIAPTGTMPNPHDEEDRTIEAEREKFFYVPGLNDKWIYFNVPLFSDPIVLGKYPQKFLDEFKDYLPEITEEDMKLISQPIDFLGQNMYGNIYWGSKFLYERYKLPIYVTENGIDARNEVVNDEGKIRDDHRIVYLQKYLALTKRAVDEGIPIKGYFYWSLMDNFEWIWGYARRFGLIYVNYETQQRILKESAKWYRNYIENAKKDSE